MIRVVAFSLLLASYAAEELDYSDCNAYKELEKAAPCGPDGYAKNFGEPICKNFVSDEWMYWPNGQAFIECARPCLANFVTVNITNKGITNCTEITQLAFESHVPCYNQCGFCDMVLDNTPQLTITFARKFDAFFSDEAFQQTISVGSDCLSNPLRFLLSALTILQ